MHTFTGEALGLAVERLVLTEFLVRDHRQQAGAGEGAGDDMERRGRLADRLAITASEFFPHILEHLVLAGRALQCLGHRLAQLGQARSAAACAGIGPRQHDPLARQMIREGLA